MRQPAPSVHFLPSFVRTRIVPAAGTGSLEKVTWLTPYSAEEIGQAAWRAGPGAKLEVTVPQSAKAENVAAVDAMFAWLRERPMTVVVVRATDSD